MKNISACLSHQSDEWRTPSKLYAAFMNRGYIDLFPYGSIDNQFDKSYKNNKLYINPPFSKLSKVIDYVIDLYFKGNVIYLLMPVRTDTRYFDKLFTYCYKSMRIYFIKGRLHFNDSIFGAPFPTMIVGLNLDGCPHNEFWTTTIDEMECYIQ